MKKVLLLFSIIMLVSACSIQIRGVKSNYSNTYLSRPHLIKKIANQEDICKAIYSDTFKILQLNGLQLKECIEDKNKVLIYLWNGNCKGDFCYPLDRIQSYLSEKNINLFVLAQYYDVHNMSQYYNIDYPIIGIDVAYYKTDLVKKHTQLFFTDLNIKRDNLYRFIYLENGKYIKSVMQLEEIK